MPSIADLQAIADELTRRWLAWGSAMRAERRRHSVPFNARKCPHLQAFSKECRAIMMRLIACRQAVDIEPDSPEHEAWTRIFLRIRAANDQLLASMTVQEDAPQ